MLSLFALCVTKITYIGSHLRTICPPQLLRFATHFILFLDEMRALGTPDAVPSLTGFEEARSTIIGAYIRHLISAGHVRVAICTAVSFVVTFGRALH